MKTTGNMIFINGGSAGIALVATEMTADRNDKKISTQEMVKGLIVGLQKEHYTIRVGDAKLFNLINRFFPKTAFKLVNPKKSHQLLKN